jgi:transposase
MSVILRCFLEGQLALFSGSMALNGSAAPVLMRETEGRQSPESEWVRRAWDLRIDGCSVREIAQRLGISYAQARRLVQLAYTDPGIRLSETAEVARELDSARLDQLIRAYLPLALNTRTLAERIRNGETITVEDAAVPFAAAKVLLETLSQRAKLFGLYIHTKMGPGQARQDTLAWVQSVAPSIQRAVNDLECALESSTIS